MINPESNLPPGFRFHPTDEELILHYLRKKITTSKETPPYPVSIIAQIDIYKFDPWDLPAKAAFGQKEWYFFSPRDRKYPNGVRPNRAASSGYWKATGTDKPVLSLLSTKGENVGVKKALVFYKGRPPKGIKTNWIMHEYRLTKPLNKPMMKLKDSSMRLDDWVLCRIYKKCNSFPTPTTILQEHEDSLIQESLSHNTFKPHGSSSFSNLFDSMDYSNLANCLLPDNQFNSTGFEQYSQTLTYNNQDQSITDNNGSSSSNYLIQKLFQMDASVLTMENQLKRQHSMVVNNFDEGMLQLHPSKKLMSSCSFTDNTHNQMDIHQYYSLNLE